MNTTVIGRTARAALCTLVGGLLVLQTDVSLAAPIESASKLPAPRFTSATSSPLIGQFPGGLAVADFTGDGKADVAVAVSSVSAVPGVQVLVGNGHGGFKKRVDTPLPDDIGASDLAAGDLDGDGDPDLAVSTAGRGESPVYLLSNDGHGSFTVTQKITITGFPASHPAIGRLNADGKADLAVVREVGGLSVYLGKGNGTVGAPTDYPEMSSNTIRAIDVTGDGKTDLSFTGPSTMVNQGDGTFSAPVGADYFALASTVVDLDGDGIPDGAGVDASGRHVLVGRGPGDGSYHLVNTLTLPAQTLAVAGGDFTGDGMGDLIVNGDGQVVYLLAGHGDFTFDAPVGYSTGSARLTAGALGGSKAADLVSLSSDPGQVYGVLGGDLPTAAELIPSAVPGSVALGDVDNDGLTDIVTGGGILPEGDDLQSALGTDLSEGKGRFAATKVSVVRDETAGSGIAGLTLADVNLDGKLDAVGGLDNVQFSSSNLFVALGRGNGTFAHALLTDTGDSQADVLSVAVADVTGDGKPDIVANTRSQTSVLPGKGNGTFKAPILSGTTGARLTETLLGDVTGDGRLDAVLTIITGDTDVASSDLVVEQGDGKGHFTEVQRVSIDSNVFNAALTDLNNDGRPDLAADGKGGTDGGRGGLFVLLDTASGVLASPVYYPVGGGSLVAADLNLDGTVDLATDGPRATTAIALNRGNGRFVLGAQVITPAGPGAAGDVTGDGSPDLVMTPSASPAAVGLAVNRRH